MISIVLLFLLSILSVPVSVPSVLSISTPFSLAVSQSMPAWSHHLLGTFAPSLVLAPSHRSRSSRVVMYCATVFCLLSIEVQISVNPASLMAPSSEG